MKLTNFVAFSPTQRRQVGLQCPPVLNTRRSFRIYIRGEVQVEDRVKISTRDRTSRFRRFRLDWDRQSGENNCLPAIIAAGTKPRDTENLAHGPIEALSSLLVAQIRRRPRADRSRSRSRRRFLSFTYKFIRACRRRESVPASKANDVADYSARRARAEASS